MIKHCTGTKDNHTRWSAGALLVLLASAVAGCDNGKGAGNSAPDTARATATASVGATAKAPSAVAPARTADTASSAATSTPSAAAAGTGAAAAAPGAASGLAGLFTGEPDPDVKFLRLKWIPKEQIVLQLLPNWQTDADDESLPKEEPSLMLTGKEEHAMAWLQVVPKKDALSAQDISLSCQRVSATDCTFEAPVDGRFGAPPGMPAKIAQGTCKKNLKPAEAWWVLAEYKPDKTLMVFASLRKDVYPKLEKQLFSTLKSVKVK